MLEKGTTNGTITNFDGEYAIDVSSTNAVLQYSYIGYQKVEMQVATKRVIDVVLKEDAQALEEVVVTALGIKRSEKALSYNVQQINADAITDNKDANFCQCLEW